MKRQFTLIFHFYKPIAILSLIFTGLSIFNFLKVGLAYINVVLIIKLTGYAITLSYQYFFAAKSYFYYRNAGYSARQMYARTFGLDFALYVTLLITAYFISHGTKA